MEGTLSEQIENLKKLYFDSKFNEYCQNTGFEIKFSTYSEIENSIAKLSRTINNFPDDVISEINNLNNYITKIAKLLSDNDSKTDEEVAYQITKKYIYYSLIYGQDSEIYKLINKEHSIIKDLNNLELKNSTGDKSYIPAFRYSYIFSESYKDTHDVVKNYIWYIWTNSADIKNNKYEVCNYYKFKLSSITEAYNYLSKIKLNGTSYSYKLPVADRKEFFSSIDGYIKENKAELLNIISNLAEYEAKLIYIDASIFEYDSKIKNAIEEVETEETRNTAAEGEIFEGNSNLDSLEVFLTNSCFEKSDFRSPFDGNEPLNKGNEVKQWYDGMLKQCNYAKYSYESSRKDLIMMLDDNNIYNGFGDYIIIGKNSIIGDSEHDDNIGSDESPKLSGETKTWFYFEGNMLEEYMHVDGMHLKAKRISLNELTNNYKLCSLIFRMNATESKNRLSKYIIEIFANGKEDIVYIAKEIKGNEYYFFDGDSDLDFEPLAIKSAKEEDTINSILNEEGSITEYLDNKSDGRYAWLFFPKAFSKDEEQSKNLECKNFVNTAIAFKYVNTKSNFIDATQLETEDYYNIPFLVGVEDGNEYSISGDIINFLDSLKEQNFWFENVDYPEVKVDASTRGGTSVEGYKSKDIKSIYDKVCLPNSNEIKTPPTIDESKNNKNIIVNYPSENLFAININKYDTGWNIFNNGDDIIKNYDETNNKFYNFNSGEQICSVCTALNEKSISYLEDQLNEYNAIYDSVMKTLKNDSDIKSSPYIYIEISETREEVDGALKDEYAIVYSGYKNTDVNVKIKNEKCSLGSYFIKKYKTEYDNGKHGLSNKWEYVNDKIVVDKEFYEKHNKEIENKLETENVEINYERLTINFLKFLDKSINVTASKINEIENESFISKGTGRFKKLNPYYICEIAKKYYKINNAERIELKNRLTSLSTSSNDFTDENLKYLGIDINKEQKVNKDSIIIDKKQLNSKNFYVEIKTFAINDIKLCYYANQFVGDAPNDKGKIIKNYKGSELELTIEQTLANSVDTSNKNLRAIISPIINKIARYVTKKGTEDSSLETETSGGYLDIENFLDTWTIKTGNNEIKNTKIVPVNYYYDMLSGMTPYINVGFRRSKGSTYSDYYTNNSNDTNLKIYSELRCAKKEIDNDNRQITYFNEIPIIAEGTRIKDGKSEIFYKKLKISIDEKSKKEIIVDEIPNKNRDAITRYFKYEIEKEVNEKEAADIFGSNYFYLDSLQYPFFKSLSIKDKGVKSFTLTLFDKDFGSYTNGMYGNKTFSLDSLIRAALIAPNSSTMSVTKTTDAYSVGSESDVSTSEYLTFNSDIPSNPANIRLRWGYCDYNQPTGFTQSKINDSEKDKVSGDSDLLEFYKEGQLRSNRWWDVSSIGSDSGASNEIKFSKFIGNKDSTEISSGVPKHLEDFETNETYNPVNYLDASLGVNDLMKSYFQTTSMSREYEFLITGFKTNLKSNGIEYVLNGIEAKNAQLLTTRFLQRYAEITSYPEEVLYLMERIFNENTSNQNITSSPVKIVIQKDENDGILINQEYDMNMITQGQRAMIDGTTTYQNTKNNGIILTKALKNITVSFGGDEAVRNYDENPHVPLYKNVSTLLDEFCASCPPKELDSNIKSKNEETYNVNGEKVVETKDVNMSRPLKWYSLKDRKTNVIYAVLYYRQTKPQEIIKKYTWGPNNPTLSCVKDLSIENKNEFAILSGVLSFNPDGDNTKLRLNTSEKISNEEKISYENIYDPSSFNGVNVNNAGVNSKYYDYAFSQSMYGGTMTIQGDPFYAFDFNIQPYTYPIYLDVVIPMNEETARRDFKDDSALYYSSKKRLGNQMLHESSGFYVITEISHDISSSGYTTTLGLSSYPNIKNDIVPKGYEFYNDSISRRQTDDVSNTI